MRCCGGQTDREGVLAERDAALAQLTAQLVRTPCIDVVVSGPCWSAVPCNRCCGGQMDREGELVERDTTVTQLTALLVGYHLR
jgi:hypothetical protein